MLKSAKSNDSTVSSDILSPLLLCTLHHRDEDFCRGSVVQRAPQLRHLDVPSAGPSITRNASNAGRGVTLSSDRGVVEEAVIKCQGRGHVIVLGPMRLNVRCQRARYSEPERPDRLVQPG